MPGVYRGLLRISPDFTCMTIEVYTGDVATYFDVWPSALSLLLLDGHVISIR